MIGHNYQNSPDLSPLAGMEFSFEDLVENHPMPPLRQPTNSTKALALLSTVATSPSIPTVPEVQPSVFIGFTELPRMAVTPKHAQEFCVINRHMDLNHVEHLINLKMKEMKTRKSRVTSWANEHISDMMINEAKNLGWTLMNHQNQSVCVTSFAQLQQAYAQFNIDELHHNGFDDIHSICFKIFGKVKNIYGILEAEFMRSSGWEYVGKRPPGKKIGCVAKLITDKKYDLVRRIMDCARSTHGFTVQIRSSAGKNKNTDHCGKCSLSFHPSMVANHKTANNNVLEKPLRISKKKNNTFSSDQLTALNKLMEKQEKEIADLKAQLQMKQPSLDQVVNAQLSCDEI